jgi:low affinity Fe/Cu permease
MNEIFRKFAEKTSEVSGSSWTFAGFLLAIMLWFVVGFFMHYSEQWQSLFDNSTNIIFLLLLLLMQNTQNRDSKVIHLKLNELLRAVEGARTGLVHLENLSDADLERLVGEFESLHKGRREASAHGEPAEDVVGGLIPSLDEVHNKNSASLPEAEAVGSSKA